MNAVIDTRLTDPEAREAIYNDLKERLKDRDFFTQVISEADAHYITAMQKSVLDGKDWFRFGELFWQAAYEYHKACGYDEEAINEARDIKYVSRVTVDPE